MNIRKVAQVIAGVALILLIIALMYFGIRYFKERGAKVVAEVQVGRVEEERLNGLLEVCLDATIEVRNSFLEDNGTLVGKNDFTLTNSQGEYMDKVLKDSQDVCFKKYK